MTRPARRSRNAVAVALYVNAALLLAILVAMLSRGGPSLSILPRAFGAEGQPIAGGGNLYLMPGQLSLNKFGCYVMDTDAQTLCVYEYYAGEKSLRLVGARNFRHDRRLGNFNTEPDPREVEKWVEAERTRGRTPGPAERGQDRQPARDGSRDAAPPDDHQ